MIQPGLKGRHFLEIRDLTSEQLRHLVDLGASYKKALKAGKETPTLKGKSLALIFEKSSTRTRVSFDVGMFQMGGHTVNLLPNDMQLGRGETVPDTARVLSRYVDAVMLRTDMPRKMTELAAHATIPVINGLTDDTHPCQIIADIMTFEEHRGPITGKVVAWTGDGNNVAASWAEAAVRLGFEFRLACPAELAPPAWLTDWVEGEKVAGATGTVTVMHDPKAAAEGADCVVTDAWTSMHQEGDGIPRNQLLAPFQVDEALMALAKDDALFMHCLPAHRGEEVTDAVIEGPHSVVFDEAENRLHSQKGILHWCLLGDAPLAV
ncbi:MAG: ornithine carbamoyltransferase [Alphaproteobacteria bacterium]|nr:ornithine carbamoyltransferase [Alphaproteobacteria bacterium SS10]